MVLALTNSAFEIFFSRTTTAANYSSHDEIEAQLSYYLLRGVHSTSSIIFRPEFIPTLLTNSSYANVRPGQVVRAVSNNSIIIVSSAIICVSKLVDEEYDMIFLGGLIHALDELNAQNSNQSCTWA
jgi:transforming growth factor-beta-induced protein